MIKPGNTRRGVYSKPVNQLLTLPVSHLCELIRWLLDRGGVPYRESGQVPVLHFFAFLLAGADTKAMPVLITNEATLGSLREAIDYIDARLPEALRLWPSNPSEREQTERLLGILLNDLAIATRNYAYAMLLPHKEVVLPLWQQRVPGWQQWLAAKIYLWLAGVLAKKFTGRYCANHHQPI
ncbi:glutathione S-transferase N-terminal domain-containing protein [Methylocucumis oryzae]|uniref:GST N-terminal domain-containing protein n=1 Tax=Methylocucumis oryzae TaxID=1632867 RepID=A0A0F3IIP5_9GAMM|nr:hypothetical protein [Methylocucumis oryzae]KJV06547.1 hypothetical protein VZ94_10435 [Methylocucumis oryzae]